MTAREIKAALRAAFACYIIIQNQNNHKNHSSDKKQIAGQARNDGNVFILLSVS